MNGAQRQRIALGIEYEGSAYAGWQKQPDKWIPVTWKNEPGKLFASQLRVEVQNRVGVLADAARKAGLSF